MKMENNPIKTNSIMTNEEKIFEMAKALAPLFAQKGIEMQERLIAKGISPENCRIADKNIPHAYGENLRLWAVAFVEELQKGDNNENA